MDKQLDLFATEEEIVSIECSDEIFKINFKSGNIILLKKSDVTKIAGALATENNKSYKDMFLEKWRRAPITPESMMRVVREVQPMQAPSDSIFYIRSVYSNDPIPEVQLRLEETRISQEAEAIRATVNTRLRHG